MTDTEIIDLFFERSEQAITELDKKHGNAVARVARNMPNKAGFEPSGSERPRPPSLRLCRIHLVTLRSREPT